jgi:hypothetical protein
MYIATLTAASHAFTFEQQISGGGGTVNIRAMRICLTRLA